MRDILNLDLDIHYVEDMLRLLKRTRVLALDSRSHIPLDKCTGSVREGFSSQIRLLYPAIAEQIAPLEVQAVPTFVIPILKDVY